MDVRSWKKVLLQWITECGLTERNYYNIEQSDIGAFYQNFSLKHQKTATENFTDLSDFIKEFYPSFELNFDDENCLSSADYIYVYSLLLHFSCVKHPDKVFHEICQRLSDYAQQCIASFFKELLDTEPITKEAIRRAIAEVAKIQITPPRLSDSFASSTASVSAGGLGSISYSRCESPIKTPRRPQRISPSTPKSLLLEERTRELFNLKAQLDTERYEKGLLEVEIKKNEDKIQKLNNDHKKLLQQIQDLRNDIFVNNSSDGSNNCDNKENQIQKRLLKELAHKEQEITNLSENIRTLREEKSLVEENRKKAEKEKIVCLNRIEELECKFEELKEELRERNTHINFLTERRLELEQFIANTRSSNGNRDCNESIDCMDSSFSRNANNTNSSNSISSPENLGVSVVDIQLREKEYENQQLRKELKKVKREQKCLAKYLTKLTEEFDLPLDSSSPNSSEYSEPDTEEFERESAEESYQCNKISGEEEQFNLFKYCIEKINEFLRNEKNKLKQLEQETNNLQGEKQDLAIKLQQLNDDIDNLKRQLNAKERLHKELENTKVEIEICLEKSQTDLQKIQKQNEKLYQQMQSLEHDNKLLNENIQELKTNMESQQKENLKLLENNKKLEGNEKSLGNQLNEMKMELFEKSLQWEKELKTLRETTAKQSEEIEAYKQAEATIKRNLEDMVIQNEKLKKDTRQVNSYLTDMKNQLMEKEKQMTSLGEEIDELKKSNHNLEQNINDLLQEHNKGKLEYTDINNQLRNVKEQLSKTTLLMESKEHECDIKQQQLEDLETKVSDIQKLFGESSVKDNIFKNLAEIEIKFKNLINIKNELNNEIKALKEKQIDDHSIIQELNLDVKEKTEMIYHAEEKVSLLKKENDKIEKKNKNLENELKQANEIYASVQKQLLKLKELKNDLENKLTQHKQEHDAAVEKLHNDIKEKEKSLQEAQTKYESSMELLTTELKLEKEEHNNKQMEFILITAENAEIKKKLQENEQDLVKLQMDNQLMQESFERLKNFETKVVECTAENEKLRHEIETFKEEVTQNALRLIEADRALAEFMELTKQQDSVKSEVECLRTNLKEKEELNSEIELKYKNQLATVQEQLEKLDNNKNHLAKEIEEKNQQILKEQQDKLMLLNSLEKSTDQFKLVTEEKQLEINSLEQKLQELKEQFDVVTLQNIKLRGDLVELEAELRLNQDEKTDFQQKLSQLMQDLSKKSNELKAIDMALKEIVAITENNFNLAQEWLKSNDQPYENIFKYNKMESEKSVHKLRQQLNFILNKQQLLEVQFKEVSTDKDKAILSVSALQASINELQTKYNEQEKAFAELRDQLANEEVIMEKRIYQEVKRLEEDLLNLEKVNERLANENVKIQVKLGNVEQDLKDYKLKLQASEEESLQLKEQLRSESLTVERLQKEEKKLQHHLKEKQQQSEKISEKSKQLEVQLKDKISKLQNLEKECQDLKEKAIRNQQKLSHYQQIQQSQQTENKKLQEKLKLLQTSNETMELEIDNLNKELLALKNKNTELLQQNNDFKQQLHLTTKNLDEIATNKLNAETKCEQLQSEVQQLKRDLEFVKTQQQTQQDDNNRLLQEIDSLKVDKQHLRDEINDNKTSLQRSNDNVTQLIQQISSIRLEKESALKEIQLLRKQLEETGKHQTTSETKMKSIIEKSQDFERKLLAAENELKSLKVNFEKSESNSEKLRTENKKLRDSQEVSTKRIEKLALKLGDSQARSSKLERDNEKLSKTLEAHTVTVEALQKEKDMLQAEAKSLKERVSRAERGHEQLVAKKQNLEHQITSLQQIKQKLEASEIDSKIKINKLEKLREVNEEKLRKLTNDLNNAENANVKLNLEVGSLNSQIQEIKIEHKQAQQQREHKQIEELKHKLDQAQELANKFEELNKKLKIEINNLNEENSSLNDQLSKTSLSLQITSKKYKEIISELEQIRAEILIIRQEKSQIELQHDTSIQKLTQFETENTKLINERENIVRSLEQRITNLEEELLAKEKEVVGLQKEIEALKENRESYALAIQQNAAAANHSEVEELRKKLSLAEETRQKEQQIISELRLDNQILHTKYQESKKRVLEAEKLSEERIKETRLELEGKLEKMKTKMKTLYTAEITKMKSKQECEMVLVKSELDVLKTQNTKYEEHNRKLSTQIVRLNENILQHQKENAILSTKLKHLTEQAHDNERNRRPSSIHVSSISSTSTGPIVGGPNNIGTNLAMEDEEGEIFNNTYLTDLKNGRMTELMSRDVCVEELKYRNSLLPPHLRSTYAAQFDHELSEDDLKDGPHSFDDSMSALLSTTAGGTRKKCTGVTHYKRPGPPTPSKNGGRLSFGGNSEPSREILKETYDANAVSSTKTPARFNFFTSRFSMGSSRDEKPLVIKTSSNECNLRKTIFKSKDKGNNYKILAEVGCTSTPRKSKVHYDQRRLLDQLMISSPSPSPLALDNKATNEKLTPPDKGILETPLTALDSACSPKAAAPKTNTKRLEAIASGLKRFRRNSSMFGRRLSRRIQEICTPTSSETTSSALSTPLALNNKGQRQEVISSVPTSGSVSKSALLKKRLRSRPKPEKKTRPSLYIRGNIFAKYKSCTPNKGALRELNRYKSRKQRCEHFNQGRNIKSFKSETQAEEHDVTLSNLKPDVAYDLKNNNYATFVNNKTMEKTVLIKKPEDTFTFGEEQFENLNTEDHSDYVRDYKIDKDEEYSYEDEENYNSDDNTKKQFSLKKESNKQELVTSQDLENFDNFIANIRAENKQENYIDNCSSKGSSRQFKKILIETKSNAPFEVNCIDFNVSQNNHSSKSKNSECSSDCNHSYFSRSNDSNTQINSDYEHTAVSTATPHLSPNNPNCQLSRTIYGGTVIYNHRLPHINTTYVRKSSIYVKNRHRTFSDAPPLESLSSSNDVILITNQTITFVDIMRMWSQMDNYTRLIISFAILASFTTLLGLFVSFCPRR